MNKVRRYLAGMSIGLATLAGLMACHKGVSAATAQPQQEQQGPDPTDQNMIPVDSSGEPIQTGNASQQLTQYPGGAPIERREPSAGPQDQYQSQVPLAEDQSYLDAQNELYNDQDVSGEPPIEAEQPPPELPVYEQPEAPGPNYLWTPGYWGYAPVGYYWVPGAWVMAPYPGALWTPCYWGFYGGRYRFYHGYWGLHIGFYGGINYGYGYYGVGYRGGYWNGNNFYYNRAINRVPARITNVYVRNVTIVNAGNRVSFNGGRGGLQVRPHPAEVAAMRAPRTPPMSTQRNFQQQASQNRQQFYNQNRGRPAMVSAARPIAADKGIQRPNPVQPVNGVRNGFQSGGQNRPGQPVNPGNVARPGYQGNEYHQVQPGRSEVPPINRQQVQPARPAPQQTYRPDSQPAVRPAPEAHPNPQYRPQTQQQPRPNVEQPHPQQVRPTQQYHPETQQQPRPEQQARPTQQYRPETQPRPEQQSRPTQQYRPAEPRPAPQVRTPPPAQAPQMHTAPPPQQAHPAPAHTEPAHPH